MVTSVANATQQMLTTPNVSSYTESAHDNPATKAKSVEPPANNRGNQRHYRTRNVAHTPHSRQSFVNVYAAQCAKDCAGGSADSNIVRSGLRLASAALLSFHRPN